MSTDEAVNALGMRCQSLEDILRQQEQTISVLLGRIRDLEQFVGNEARNRDANQNQINQILGDRSTENLSERIGLLLQSQSERLSALQADAQTQRAALQGIDGKFDAAFHGLENKVQGDVRALQERLSSGERATSEALQTTQASLQGQAAAVQQVDAKCRDAVQGLQSMVRDSTSAARDGVEALEARTRDALRELHGALSGDVKAASAQLESLVHQAIRNQNAAMLTLDQRVRTEVAELHQSEQADFQAAQQRMAAIEATGRELVQVAQSGLAAEIAAVAKHSQAVDSRQQSAHQTLVQELSKHDQQMEAIDVNWRASVTDLNGKVDAEVAGTRGQAAAGDQALQGQVAQVRDQLRAIGEKLNNDLNDLAGRVQDNCVVPLERLNVTTNQHDGTLTRLVADGDKMREFLRVFSQEVDRNANQIRQLMESTLRASHSDLLDRINVVSASVALRQDPEAVFAQINDALSKIWSDSSSSFATQRDVNDMQSQITSLESAIRIEIHALAEKDNDLHHRIDEVQVPLRWVVQQQQQQPQATRQVERAAAPPSSSPGTVATTSTTTNTTSTTNAATAVPDSAVHDVKQYASTAEAAQDECVRLVNEARAALTEVRSVRSLVEAAATREPTTPATQATKGGEEAQPETPPAAAARALAMQRQEAATARAEALLAEVQQAQRGLTAQQEDLQTLLQHERARQAQSARPAESERVSSAPAVRRVSGTQHGNTFFVRGAAADDDDANENSVSARGVGPEAPSPTAYAGRNNEMLLPTHQFVRKKEYTNFKDFVKQELDTLWVEVLNLRRITGVSREELMMHLAQSKNTILNGVLNAMMKQESEMLAVLSSLKLQVAKSLGDGTVRTDIKLFPPHNGTIDIDQLIRDIDILSARLGNPTTTSITTHATPPPPQSYITSFQPAPSRPSDAYTSRPPPVSAASTQPPLSLGRPTEPPSVVSSGRSTEPLPTQFIPRVAPYMSGTAHVPTPAYESPLYESYSPRQPDAIVGSAHATHPRLQASEPGPYVGAVAAGPIRLVGSNSKPASPLAPPSLTRPRLGGGPVGPLQPLEAKDTAHVTAWDPREEAPASKPTSAPAARNPKGSVFHLNPLQGVQPPLLPGVPAYPQERPIQSAPTRPPNQLAPLPSTTAPPPAAYPSEAPRGYPAEAPRGYPADAPADYPSEAWSDPRGPATVEDDAWEQTPSDMAALLLEMQQKPQPQPSGGPPRRAPPVDADEDMDAPVSEGHYPYDEDVSDGGEPRNTRSSRRKNGKNSRKPRSRSGSRSGRHPSSRSRRTPSTGGAPPSSQAPPQASHSETPTPSDDDPVAATATPSADPDPAVTAKPPPAGSGNIRVYPSPEGVRVGHFPQNTSHTGGTNGHIYAPGKDAKRLSTFSSAAGYDEL